MLRHAPIQRHTPTITIHITWVIPQIPTITMTPVMVVIVQEMSIVRAIDVLVTYANRN